MRAPLRQELDRLLQIHARLGVPIVRVEGASRELIQQAEKATGIEFDDDLRALYAFSNGGTYAQMWFAVMTDQESPLPFRFYGLDEVMKRHHSLASYCDADYDNGGEPWDPRHRKLDQHTRWLPIADFGNGNAVLYFDADPTSMGDYGQLITYQHDPDAIRFLASGLVEFLALSNDLLMKHGAELL